MTVAPDTAPPTSRLKRVAELDQSLIVAFLVIGLIVVFSFVIDGFARWGNATAVLQASAGLGILALGQAIVVIGRGLDLSVVVIFAVTTQFAIEMMNDGRGELSALLIALVSALVLGLINGVLIAYVDLPPLFVTLATSLGYLGASRILVSSNISFTMPSDATIMDTLGNGDVLGLPVCTVVWLLLAAAIGWFASSTSAGQMIYARGDNPEAARLAGMPTRPLIVLTYLISASTAFLAGLVIVASAGSFDTRALSNGSTLYDVLAIVVIAGVSLAGGRGRFLGVVAATFFISILLNGMTLLNLDVIQQSLLKSVIILGALILDRKLHPTDDETARVGEL